MQNEIYQFWIKSPDVAAAAHEAIVHFVGCVLCCSYICDLMNLSHMKVSN